MQATTPRTLLSITAGAAIVCSTLAAAPSPASANELNEPTAKIAMASAGSKVVSIAKGQVGYKESGNNCTKYSSQCVSWCALFATWVWNKAGIKIPRYAFTGDLYNWGKSKGRSHWVKGKPLGKVNAGDLVLYGSGPSSPSTSTHVDIVVGVYKDHLKVIGGNVSNKVTMRNVPRKNIYAWVDAR
ncbi:CHAP domain-containing protein [Luteipulveratus mongoliensis]|nr:CHAP domain-containing protein [Luteipulveratus mongoliensis]